MALVQQALNIQVTLPDQETPFFVQLQSSSSLANLKSHIFRKVQCLATEKPQSYVLAVQAGNKMEMLSEEKKILQSNRIFEEQQRSGKLLTLFLLRKESPAPVKKKEREISSPVPDRINRGKRDSQVNERQRDDTKTNPITSDRFHFTRLLSAQQFVQIPPSLDQRRTSEDAGKALMVRSKSEPILHRDPTRSFLSEHSFTETESMESNMMSSTSSVDSLSEDDDEPYDPTRLSPRVPTRELAKSTSLVRPDGNVDVKKKGKKSSWIIFGPRDKFSNSPPVESKPAQPGKQIYIKLDSMASVATPEMFSPKMEVSAVLETHPSSPASAPNTPPVSRSGSDSESSLHSSQNRKHNELVSRTAFYSNKPANPGLQVELDNEKPMITAGLFEELVNCLADRDIPDHMYMDEFFYSLTYFTNCNAVIQHLRARFDYFPPPGSPPEIIKEFDFWRTAIQQRVLYALRYWLENHWYHFERDIRLLAAVKALVESGPVRANIKSKPLREVLLIKEGLSSQDGTPPGTTRKPSTISAAHSPPLGSPDGAGAGGGAGSQDLGAYGRSTSSPIISWKPRASVVLDTHTTHYPTAPNLTMGNTTTDMLASSLPSSVNTLTAAPSSGPQPKVLGKKFKDYRKVAFMRVHPVEMARQLTLIESEMFRSIAPLELTASAWKKKNKVDIAPSIVRMIDWFNKMTSWIATEIVMTPNPKERALVLSRFIQVADSCRSMNNFNTTMEILSALNLVCVKRLYKTWKQLSKKETERFAEMEDTLLPKANYHKYRLAVAEAQATRPPAPVLPYIGIVLQDLLMIEELPTFLPNTEGAPVFINFRKMRRFTSVLRAEILEKQARVYFFQQVPVLQEYLVRGLNPLAEADLYKYSRLCEPSNLV